MIAGCSVLRIVCEDEVVEPPRRFGFVGYESDPGRRVAGRVARHGVDHSAQVAAHNQYPNHVTSAATGPFISIFLSSCSMKTAPCNFLSLPSALIVKGGKSTFASIQS
jgi:hypothetical protein